MIVQIEKRLLISLLLFALVSKFSQAQNGYRTTLTSVEVSGIVQDSAGDAIANATVKLITSNDSLTTTTDGDGIFNFAKATSHKFSILVTAVGWQRTLRKYNYATGQSRITLDAIIVRNYSQQLAEVNINGTAGISYKTDTVEYRAKDYRVRTNDNIEDLLRKMEGMSVSNSGELSYQGEEIKKAKVNGKIFSGGDVAQAIKNLPAEIADKIQIVDDYGEQSARTGIKSGAPIKILNIVTRADKSIGNMLSNTSGAGTGDRFKETLFLQRLDGNKQFGMIGSINNTVNGIPEFSGKETSEDAGAPVLSKNQVSNGSGGQKRIINNSLSYRNTWGPRLQVNASYNYINKKDKLQKNSLSRLFNPLGNTDAEISEISEVTDQIHGVNFELQFTPDSSNFLLVTPVLSFERSEGEQRSDVSQSGLINQRVISRYDLLTTKPTYGAIAFYQHIFGSTKRNISLQTEFIYDDLKSDNYQINVFNPTNAESVNSGDSLSNRNIIRRYQNKSLKNTFTFTEPLKDKSQLEFIGEWSHVSRSNRLGTFTNNLSSGLIQIDSLSNAMNYSFNQQSYGIDYRLNSTRFSFTIGLKALSANIHLPAYLNHDPTNTFYFVPITRFSYNISRTKQLTINYSASMLEPSYYQLQPGIDYSNPLNPIKGNFRLRPSLVHHFQTNFNSYFPNSRLNLSGGLKAAFIRNAVVSNTNLLYDEGLANYVNETTFTNQNGSVNGTMNLSLSKAVGYKKHLFEYNTIIKYFKNPFLNNGEKNFNSIWRMSQNIGPRLLFGDKVELNPYAGFIYYKSDNTLLNASQTHVKSISISLEHKLYLEKWQAGFNGSKSFFSGLENDITTNPLLLNLFIQRTFLKHKNGILRIEGFDLLNQNKFINRILTENTVTDIRSNLLSRYFMVTFRLNLQKWNGSPTKNGKPMLRRNDGSFLD